MNITIKTFKFDGLCLGISPEWVAILNLEPPYLLYHQDMNSIICKLSGEVGSGDYLSPIYVNNKWTRVDFNHARDNENEVVGFDLLHLGEGTFFLPRLFSLYTSDDLSLWQVVQGVSNIAHVSGRPDVFGDLKDFFLNHELANELKLQTFDVDWEELLVTQKIVTRDSLSSLNMRLLS